MSERKIAIGLVGTGLIMRNAHIPALQKLSAKFVITAVCSGHIENARRVAEMFPSARAFPDTEQMLRGGDVEAVDIATPIVLNAALAMVAARAGKHVFLEKPIAGALEDARTVVDTVKDIGTVLLVAETNRYLPGYRQAREVVQSGMIGEPKVMLWRNTNHITQRNDYSQTTWRQHPEHLGGYLSDGGVHAAAAAQMVLGPVVEVQAITSAFNQPLLGPVDTMLVNLKFESGVAGHLTFSVGLPECSPTPLQVFGPNGRVDVEPSTIHVTSNGRADSIPLPDVDPFEAEFEDFYNGIVYGQPLQALPNDALADLAIIDAALRSAESNQVTRP